MSYKVNATDLTNIRFNEADTLSSVLQNIAVILSTPKGSEFAERITQPGTLWPTVEVEIIGE